MFSEIIAIWILHLILYGRSSNKRLDFSELKIDVKFVKFKKRFFKRHATSYQTNIQVGNIKAFAIFDPSTSACDLKCRLTNQIGAQRSVSWRPNPWCDKAETMRNSHSILLVFIAVAYALWLL